MKRLNKNEYYIQIATQVALRGTCRRRNYGAVIVKNDEIISTGYTGSPRGCDNCINNNECLRDKLNVPGKQRYELCKSVHAEMNAIISAARKDMIGSTMYLVGLNPDFTLHDAMPCDLCKKMIINSGISKVITKTTMNKIIIMETSDFINDINNLDLKNNDSSELNSNKSLADTSIPVKLNLNLASFFDTKTFMNKVCEILNSIEDYEITEGVKAGVVTKKFLNSLKNFFSDNDKLLRRMYKHKSIVTDEYLIIDRNKYTISQKDFKEIPYTGIGGLYSYIINNNLVINNSIDDEICSNFDNLIKDIIYTSLKELYIATVILTIIEHRGIRFSYTLIPNIRYRDFTLPGEIREIMTYTLENIMKRLKKIAK